MTESSRQQELESAGHVTYIIRNRKQWMHIYSVYYLHFVQFKIPLPGNGPIKIKMGFPLSINIIKTIYQMSIFQMILDYVKLTKAEKKLKNSVQN